MKWYKKKTWYRKGFFHKVIPKTWLTRINRICKCRHTWYIVFGRIIRNPAPGAWWGQKAEAGPSSHFVQHQTQCSRILSTPFLTSSWHSWVGPLYPLYQGDCSVSDPHPGSGFSAPPPVWPIVSAPSWRCRPLERWTACERSPLQLLPSSWSFSLDFAARLFDFDLGFSASCIDPPGSIVLWKVLCLCV